MPFGVFKNIRAAQVERCVSANFCTSYLESEAVAAFCEAHFDFFSVEAKMCARSGVEFPDARNRNLC